MDEQYILEQKAIDSAISLQWDNAIQLNEKIISLDKKNIEAYLRLGYAYLQKLNLKKAQKNYKKALRIQPSNHMARMNLERISILQKKTGSKNKNNVLVSLNPNLFLENPGKTKSVFLINLGQKNILVHLMIGQEVIIKPKRRKIEIRTKNGDYIGSLPDDLSKRLLIFIKACSTYSVHIKDIGTNKVVIFIKEEKKGKKVTKYMSFPNNTNAQLNQVIHEDDSKEGDEHEISEHDIDHLAESLTSEDKDYLPFQTEDQEEAEE
jgi:hypothetical protein